MSSDVVLGSDISRKDSVNTTIADGLRAAAEALAKPGETGRTEGLAGLSNRAADVLNRSADYVDEVDLERVKEGLVNQVRRNPARSLLIAGAAGLILGAILRRR